MGSGEERAAKREVALNHRAPQRLRQSDPLGPIRTKMTGGVGLGVRWIALILSMNESGT